MQASKTATAGSNAIALAEVLGILGQRRHRRLLGVELGLQRQHVFQLRPAMLSDVPTAREIAPSEKARSLIEFTEAPFSMAWPYAASPGVPADRAAALQAAFMAAHHDRQFLEEARTIGIDVTPVSAADLRRAIEDLSRAPPETFDYVRKLLGAAAGK